MSVRRSPRNLGPPSQRSSPGFLRRLLRRSELRRENKRLQKELERLRRKEGADEKRIADSEKGIADRDKRIADQEKELADLKKKIADREKKIADLEHQLAGRMKDSTNSSKPPSSDGPAAPKRKYPQRNKSGRKPGGQVGHPGKHRPLVPVEDVTRFVPVLPVSCGHCGSQLGQDITQVCTHGEVHRHQVTELPEIRPEIIEYQFPNVVCPDCGETTRAPLPRELRDHFGPRLTGLIAYLTAVCRVPRRGVEELLETALGTSISLGSAQKLIEQTSAALEAPYQELESQLRHEPVVNADETGWRESAKKLWLWVFVTTRYVVFVIATHRSSEVLRRMLGPEFAGILCSDRFSAYISYHKGRAQFCWAHLKRDLLGALELARTHSADRFCRDALALHARMFRLWHRFRQGDIDRPQLILKAIPLEQRFFALAERHLDNKDREVRTLARAFFFQCERLFAFIEHPNVDPTNNISERTLRPAVQWRKICFGNRSVDGQRATERLLTATRTCILQRRNALAFLTHAVQNYRRGLPVPSLLPQQP